MTPDPAAVPAGWQAVRLGDVCAPPAYGANASARPFDPELPRYVRITDITDGGRLRTDDPRSAEPAKVKGYELHAGDLLFARSGSVGRTYLYRPEDGSCVFAGYLIRFRPDPEIALPRFVELYTHSSSYHRWVASILRVGAQPNINAAEYRSLPILLPPLAEQRAIAAVLDAIDEAIERTEEVIAATEHLRDALLHELLTRGLPGRHSEWADVPGLGTVPACWDVVRLGDVCQRITKGTTPTTLGHEYAQTGVRFLRVENIRDGLVEGGQLRFISEETHRALSRSVLREHDLLLSIAGALGRSALVTKDVLPANVNQALAIIRLGDDPRTEPEFMSLALRARGVQRQVDGMRSELAQANINLEQVGSLRVPHPPIEEQQAIAAALDGVDNAIARAREELARLHSLQASAADALLTGRVRVAAGAGDP